ncbi:MAG: FAD binding domain-containing protein [Acidobacteriota bacterium]|nr:FAD binding domain-containing protein [Acidobacteriota bacterium]
MSAATEFLAPETVRAAVAALAGDEDAVAVGGASAVSLMMKEGLLLPSRLVWLGRLPDWDRVESRPGRVHIGAGATLAALARSQVVRQALPAVAAAAGVAANPRVRAVATIGGHLAHADPRQDLPPVLLAAGASVAVVGPAGERQVSLDDLLVGFYETALEPGEIITAVEIPVAPGSRQVYARFNPASADDYPTVGVAVHLVAAADGSVSGVRVAVGGCAARAVLLPRAAALLEGLRPSAAEMSALQASVEADVPVAGDHRGSEAYKRRVAGVWARRAVEAARAGGGPLLSRS